MISYKSTPWRVRFRVAFTRYPKLTSVVMLGAAAVIAVFVWWSYFRPPPTLPVGATLPTAPATAIAR